MTSKTAAGSLHLARACVGFLSGPRFLRAHCAVPRFSRRQSSAPCARFCRAAQTRSSAEAGVAPTPTYNKHSWEWRGHRIRWASAGCGKPIVLVHGFGASCDHFKKNIPVLASQGYKVYALDLLGFGESAKPVVDYTMEQWCELVLDFMEEFVQQPAVVVGNSLGSLTSLMVAAAAGDRVAGVCLLNCAGGMNNKAIADDWRIRLAMPLFLLIDFLLSQPPIARYLFDRFRSPENVRQVLLNVYKNPEAVDDELVDMIYRPSCDEGALEAFVSIITGPPGPRPMDLIPQINCPMLVLWGTEDPFTPADGPVGKYLQRTAEERPDLDFIFLEGVGHVPQDEFPDRVHAHLLPWLERHHA